MHLLEKTFELILDAVVENLRWQLSHGFLQGCETHGFLCISVRHYGLIFLKECLHLSQLCPFLFFVCFDKLLEFFRDLSCNWVAFFGFNFFLDVRKSVVPLSPSCFKGFVTHQLVFRRDMLGSDAHENTGFDIHSFLKVTQLLFNQFRIGNQRSCFILIRECPVERSSFGLFQKVFYYHII